MGLSQVVMVQTTAAAASHAKSDVLERQLLGWQL